MTGSHVTQLGPFDRELGAVDQVAVVREALRGRVMPFDRREDIGGGDPAVRALRLRDGIPPAGAVANARAVAGLEEPRVEPEGEARRILDQDLRIVAAAVTMRGERKDHGGRENERGRPHPAHVPAAVPRRSALAGGDQPGRRPERRQRPHPGEGRDERPLTEPEDFRVEPQLPAMPAHRELVLRPGAAVSFDGCSAASAYDLEAARGEDRSRRGVEWISLRAHPRGRSW